MESASLVIGTARDFVASAAATARQRGYHLVLWPFRHDGSDPERMHNRYVHQYNKAVFDLLRRRRGAGEAVLFSRSAWAGLGSRSANSSTAGTSSASWGCHRPEGFRPCRGAKVPKNLPIPARFCQALALRQAFAA